ncbi:vacuolar peduncle [Culex quinquefasciatus]|uniref:Vacuolar peduncle n=1 Tax=Culex quinquefasciatus TaxID=7176 RepID=B0XDQ0_CULQU|nr:vacuolar peduncle [Culex quinquefasciatus]|eukprot:XP_001867772.1 vacuolar peduncle [Culex quinquefasciatus]
MPCEEYSPLQQLLVEAELNALMILDQLTQSLFTSTGACPRTVRFICNCLQKFVVAKWPSPSEPLVRTRVNPGLSTCACCAPPS